jgi:hypothetical protein
MRPDLGYGENQYPPSEGGKAQAGYLPRHFAVVSVILFALDDNIVVLNRDRKRLGYVRTLNELSAGLDRYRIRQEPHTLRIAPRPPRSHIEFPAMPGAPKDFASARIGECARLGRLNQTR